MNELIHIENTDISVKEYKGQRVVTFKDIDMVHGRPDGTARRNFNTNKRRLLREKITLLLVRTKFVQAYYFLYLTMIL